MLLFLLQWLLDEPFSANSQLNGQCLTLSVLVNSSISIGSEKTHFEALQRTKIRSKDKERRISS